MGTIVLLSGGAADGLVKALAPAFETKTGAAIDAVFGAVGAMREKLASGHPADIVILTRAIVDELARQGAAVAATVADIGSVSTAVAIRRGDALPDVATPESLRAALLAADEIHFPDPERATAGIHFAGVIARLGLTQAVSRAIRVHPNGATAMAALARSGSAAPIGCTQATEIMGQAGAELVALLPGDLGLSTMYTATLCAGARHADHARSFIAELTGSKSATLRRSLGFEA